MKYVMLAVALFVVPALAGETPYRGAGSNPAALSSMKTCGPRIDQADRKRVFMPQQDPRLPQIVRELALARTAMGQGNEAQCEQHVQAAEALEQ